MSYPIEFIRFLLENAGTMLDVHRKVILRALGLNADINPDHLRFDLKHTYGIIALQLPERQFCRVMKHPDLY